MSLRARCATRQGQRSSAKFGGDLVGQGVKLLFGLALAVAHLQLGVQQLAVIFNLEGAAAAGDGALGDLDLRAELLRQEAL